MNHVGTSTLLNLDLPFPLLRTDRARDVFDLGNAMLIVATDRISAFGCTLPEGIPGKGRILTQIAAFWFEATKDIVPNHLVSTTLGTFPEELQSFRNTLEGRSRLARKVQPIPVRCIVRGYLAGRAFQEYTVKGSVCGFMLPLKLQLGGRLPEPMFTPSIKTEDGHHENITMAELMNLVGARTTRSLKECSLALYMRGYHLAWERGIALADASFEFGHLGDGSLLLVEEPLTPDFSRYWAENQWKPGANPPRFDQQRLHDYLESHTEWNRKPPAPHLPKPVIDSIQERYAELARRFGITL